MRIPKNNASLPKKMCARDSTSSFEGKGDPMKLPILINNVESSRAQLKTREKTQYAVEVFLATARRPLVFGASQGSAAGTKGRVKTIV